MVLISHFLAEQWDTFLVRHFWPFFYIFLLFGFIFQTILFRILKKIFPFYEEIDLVTQACLFWDLGAFGQLHSLLSKIPYQSSAWFLFFKSLANENGCPDCKKLVFPKAVRGAFDNWMLEKEAMMFMKRGELEAALVRYTLLWRKEKRNERFLEQLLHLLIKLKKIDELQNLLEEVPHKAWGALSIKHYRASFLCLKAAAGPASSQNKQFLLEKAFGLSPYSPSVVSEIINFYILSNDIKKAEDTLALVWQKVQDVSFVRLIDALYKGCSANERHKRATLLFSGAPNASLSLFLKGIFALEAGMQSAVVNCIKTLRSENFLWSVYLEARSKKSAQPTVAFNKMAEQLGCLCPSLALIIDHFPSTH